MEQSLKNSIIDMFKNEQNQLDGALDNQSDVVVPETLTETSIIQNPDGTWTKQENTKASNLYDGRIDEINRKAIDQKTQDLQIFCKEIDEKILAFNAQINAKKAQIVSLSLEAKSSNCWPGYAHSLSTGGQEKYFGTDIAFNNELENIRIYPKIAGPELDRNAKNVFEPDTVYALTGPYCGYGYKNLPERIVYKNKDGVGTGSSIDGSGGSLGPARFDISKTTSDHNSKLGSIFSVGIGTTSTWSWWYDGATSPTRCVTISNEIDTLYNDILSLRSQRDALRDDLNIIKDKKNEKELASWGMNRIYGEIDSRKTVHTEVINSVDKFNADATITDQSLILNLDVSNSVSYSGVGTAWNDLSGYGNNAILYNNPQYEYSSEGFLTFNGTTQYADTVYKSSNILGTGSWTIETWFRVNGVPSDTTMMNAIVDTNPSGATANMLYVTYGSTYPTSGLTRSRLAFSSRPTGGSSYTDILGTDRIRNGYWYHGVVVRNGSTNTKLYINGKLTNTYNGDLPTASLPFVRIGRYTDATAYSNISVAVVKIYTRSHTDIEVQNKFDASKTRFDRVDSLSPGDTTLGSSSSNPATSASAILEQNPSATNGLYWISPPGYSGSPFQVYCDMTTDGGGWMHVGTISDNNEAYSTSANHPWGSPLNPSQYTGIWEDSTTLGSQSFTADFKSLSWNVCPFTQFLIKDQGNTLRNLLYTNPGQIPDNNSSFASFWSSLSWGAIGSDYSNTAYTNGRVRGVSITTFGVSDPVLDASNKSILLLKFGEYDTAQDGNKDRTMIAWQRSGSSDNVDSPGGLGCFTNLGGPMYYRDIVPVVNQADSVVNSITGAPFNYTLWVR